jgi:hypothetical protein
VPTVAAEPDSVVDDDPVASAVGRIVTALFSAVGMSHLDRRFFTAPPSAAPAAVEELEEPDPSLLEEADDDDPDAAKAPPLDVDDDSLLAVCA